MSIKIKYKNQEIYSNNEDAIVTLPTSGSVVEGDFVIDYKNKVPNTIEKTIITNGTYNALEDNVDGYSSVSVDVPSVTAGFTSEKFKNWLEINGYSIIQFTLVSQAVDNFNIAHSLGRPATSIIGFRADLDGNPVLNKICFAISLYGSVQDANDNRLSRFVENQQYALGMRLENNGWRAVLENTSDHIQLRYVANGQNGLVWASGDYYLAVK